MKAITLTITILFGWAASPVLAASTIDTNNAYAYGANFGWCNAYYEATADKSGTLK